MNRERLEKVIEAVQNAPPELFDMSRYINELPCGTVACAIGHYCLANPQAELRFNGGYPALWREGWSNVWGYSAAAPHFDISREQVIWLFDTDSYIVPSRQEVITRIRAFIDSNGRSYSDSDRTVAHAD